MGTIYGNHGNRKFSRCTCPFSLPLPIHYQGRNLQHLVHGVVLYAQNSSPYVQPFDKQIATPLNAFLLVGEQLACIRCNLLLTQISPCLLTLHTDQCYAGNLISSDPRYFTCPSMLTWAAVLNKRLFVCREVLQVNIQCMFVALVHHLVAV